MSPSKTPPFFPSSAVSLGGGDFFSSIRIGVLVTLAVLATFLLPLRAAAQSAAEFRVIVHPDNPTRALSRAEVSKMFLKRQGNWSDGQLVKPVDQPADSPVRESFSKHVHKRSATAIRSYWQQQIYSGRGLPPVEKGSEDEIVSFVAANRDAIGYVSARTRLSGVDVVQLTD